MEIDLEQPSGEYHKEDRRPNVNVNLRDGSDVDTSQVDNERVLDAANKSPAGGGINLNTVKSIEPHDGMEFESKEEAFSFYREYAKTVGFAAVTKASRRSRVSGKFIDAKFACARYGTKRETRMTEKSQPDDATRLPGKRKRDTIDPSWSKTDCKASMHVKRKPQDGRWVVRSFIKEHNHEIFPDQVYYFRSHRNLDIGNKTGDTLQAIRARTKRTFVAMSRKSGGYKKSENQNAGVTNKTSSTQHLSLEEGDSQFMLDYFMHMQDENPNFFYAIDLNEEQRLRNVLWIDAKGRIDYGYFGDVVVFDTTYIKNEYKLPLVPFFGVNHHFQFLLFGFALIGDMTKKTYIWLMRAWLRAMGGRAPRVILTDQDEALKEAISEVFPNSHHCFCLWHILSKIPEKLGHVTRLHETFMNKFKKCIFKSWTAERFEKRWWKMVENFDLQNDAWFQSLYEDRHKWVPTFLGEKFLAGMSTFQRSESVNSFFDKHLQRKTTLKDFLEQQQTILLEKLEEEAKADFETWHKQPGLKSPSPFGKQMATLYTHEIFKKFQVEVLGVVACHPRIESEDGETKSYKVQDFEENQDFVVVWNETTSYLSCSCHLFEFNGFLCRHALIVMQMSGVHSIPSKYILERWSKDAKSRQPMREQPNVGESRVQRYNDLCRRAFRLGDEGSLSPESHDIVLNALEEALRKCESVNSLFQNDIEATSVSADSSHDCEKGTLTNGTTKTNKENGIFKKRQEQLSSRSPTLDGYFSHDQIGPGMVREIIPLITKNGGLNSIASLRNDNYNNQHSMQGLRQLNAVARTREVHYTSQERMQGVGQSHFRPETIPSSFIAQDGLQEMYQSNVGTSQLNDMGSKHLHPKHMPG